MTVDDSLIHRDHSNAYVIPENLAWIKTVCDDIDLFIFQVIRICMFLHTENRFSEAVELCIRAQNDLASADIASNPLLLDLSTNVPLFSIHHP